MILITELIFFFQSHESLEPTWICLLFKMLHLSEPNECKGKSLSSCFLLQGSHFDFEYPDMYMIASFIDNTYNIPHWNIKGNVARTNLPGCTYMRGPGKPSLHVFPMFCACFSSLDYIPSIS